MNRRDIFKGLLAVPVVVYDVSRGTARAEPLVTNEAIDAAKRRYQDAIPQAPYDTDSDYWDEWLDRHDGMHL